MAEVKKEIELLTGFREDKAIGTKDGKFFIVSNVTSKEPIEIQIPGKAKHEATDFEKGVAIVSGEHNYQYDLRYPDDWERLYSMITPSGYSIPIKGSYGGTDINNEKVQEQIKFARSIFDNPAEILKIDKKLDMASAEMIKGYVDIAKAGLEAALEKAGSDYSRDAHWGGYSAEDRKKASEAGPNYEKTLAVISKLSKKIAAKFQKMSAEYNKKMANSLSGRVKATKKDIASILDEPQREA